MLWRKIRSRAIFVVALISCPCHLPVTLPLVLVLLAGTPAAFWLAQHIGWVYGMLAGIFLLSLTLGFVWMNSVNKDNAREPRSRRSRNLIGAGHKE